MILSFSFYKPRMECNNCRKEYSSGGEFGLPLLLQCGCTYCNSCLQQLCKRSTAIKCPKCSVLTAVRKDVTLESQLPLNIYVLGLARAKELGLHRFGNNSSLWKHVLFNGHTSSKTIKHRRKEGKGVQHICSECRQNAAVFHCQQCAGLFCYGCFRVIHMTSRVLRQHVAVPVTQDSETPPTTCSSHYGQALVGVCEEEELPVCSACAESKSHRGHTHISIPEAAVKFREKLSPVLSSSKLVLQEAGRTCKILGRLIPEWQQRVKKDLETYSMSVLQLHSRLQLRELEVWQQVADSYAQLLPPALAAQEAVEEGEQEMRELLEEVEAAIKEDWRCVTSCTTLLDKLVQAHSLPARTHVKQHIGIKLLLDVEGAMEWVGQLCDVEVKGRPNVELLTVAGESLPPEHSTFPVKSISSSSSTTSSLPSSSLKLGPARSSQYLGDHDSCSTRSTSVSPLPQQMLRQSPQYRSGTSSPTPQSSSGGDLCLVEVEVVHVLDPDHIYVRDMSQRSQFRSLQQRVNNYCQEQSIPVYQDCLLLGLQCGGQDLDDIWYRVVITDITRDCTAATVQFVDCGKTCLLPVARLSMLSSSLRVCPPQVSRCRLHAIVHPCKGTEEATPIQWRDTVASVIRETVTEKVSMKVFERSYFGVLYVDLFTGHRSVSLCNKLVVAGLAVRTHSRPDLHEDIIPPPLQLGVGDQLLVQVMAAQTPWDFYFQDASTYCYEECEQLKVKLEAAYRRGDLPLVGVPLLNTYVAARFSEDKQLYRARVIEVSENGNLKLVYVDYGNTEVVYMDCVYRLPTDILQIRQQAVHACLSGVRPLGAGEDWSEDSSEFFHALCDGRDVRVVVRQATPSGGAQHPPGDKILTVSLTLIEADGEDIARVMIAANKAAPETPPSSTSAAKSVASRMVPPEESDLTLVSSKTGSSTSIASSTPPTFTTPTFNTPLPYDYKSPSVELALPTSMSTPPTPILVAAPPTLAVTSFPKPLDPCVAVFVPTPKSTLPSNTHMISPAPPISSMVGSHQQRKSRSHEPVVLEGKSALLQVQVSSNGCESDRWSKDGQPLLDGADFSDVYGDVSSAPSDAVIAPSSNSSPSVDVTNDHTSSQSSSLSSQSSPLRSPSDGSVSTASDQSRRHGAVGRAAWRARRQGSTPEQVPTRSTGRSAYRKRVESSRVIGRSSPPILDHSGPRLTGRSASAPPDHLPSGLLRDKKQPGTQSPGPDQILPSAPSASMPSPPGLSLSCSPRSKYEHPVLPPVLLPVQVGGAFKCRVVYVESPKLFFVHVEDNNAVEGGVMTLLAGLQQSLEEVPPLPTLVRGHLALAQYEGMWHRVLFQGPGSAPQQHLVLYVDYGNVDEVDVVKPMPPVLANFPPQALACCLHEPRGILSRDKFCQMVVERTLTAVLKRVTEGVMEVSFKEFDDTKVTLPNHFILPHE